MISFKNKNILITGASGGIGNELVKKYLSLGGNVLGSGTKTEKLDELGNKGLDYVIKNHDWDILADSLLKKFESLVKKN